MSVVIVLWPPEKEEQLKKLVAEGLNATTIGEQLGYSRNAIISKVRRGKGRFGKLAGNRTPRAPQDQTSKPIVLKKAPQIEALPDALPAPMARSEFSPLRMAFLDAITTGKCLFFADDILSPDGPQMTVCGHERAEHPISTRYCSHHVAVSKALQEAA